MDILKARALQYVRRLNFERCNRYQSVAEHSFYVAILAKEIAELMGYPKTTISSVFEKALLHDVPEAVTGDIPYLVRKALDPVALSNLDSMAEEEIGVDLAAPIGVLQIVAYADALEFALYLKEERESGNTTLVDIEHETWGRLKKTYNDRYAPEWLFASKLLGISPDVETKEILNGLKH